MLPVISSFQYPSEGVYFCNQRKRQQLRRLPVVVSYRKDGNDYHHRRGRICSNRNVRSNQQLRLHLATTRSKSDVPPVNSNQTKNTSTTRKTTPTVKQQPTTPKSEVVRFNPDESSLSSPIIDWAKNLLPLGLVAATILPFLQQQLSIINTDIIQSTVQQIVNDPQAFFNTCITTIEGMGSIGIVYFGIVYILAEVVAVPAVPLTLSAGYLFGLPLGVGIVLVSATIAASISFLIGKTILRSFVVNNILPNNPKLIKIDRIIGERGFKLLIVLRLSPLFPFALSNYVYGASSIDYVSYFWATLLGFAPGTIAYVYTGMVGKEIMVHTADDQPWYVYGIGFALILGVMKIISDTASGIIQSIDDDDDDVP